jgi:hypothetical protein
MNLQLILGDGGTILPCPSAFTGYQAEITDDALVMTNDKLSANATIPFTAFQSAEFGIGSGNLWLQCTVNGSPFVFCAPRKTWKSEAGKKLIEKISAVTPIKDMKEYDHYTGKLFFLYMFK